MRARILPCLRLTASVAGLVLFFFTAIWGRTGLFTILAAALVAGLGEWRWGFRRNFLGNPYLFLLLSPLLLLHYSSPWDFRIRLLCLFFLAGIIAAAWTRREPQPAPRGHFTLHNWPAAAIFGLAMAVFFSAAMVLHLRGIYLSGDEPHYLLIAQSLVEDGDIDLKNNMQAKTYLSFHPQELDFHGSVHKERWVPFHMPGLSLLLAPFYWLYARFFSSVPAPFFFRLAAGLINAIFALGLWLIMRRRFPEHDVSGLWLLFITTFPLVFHSVHLYPELPAGALLLFAFILAGEEKRYYLLAGILLAAIPWFHIKYSLPAGLLALYILARLLAARKIRESLALLLPPLASGLALLLYAKTFYESWNPNAIFPPADYFAASLTARLETFLAFFMDQRDGLLVYAPYVLFFFFGWRRKTAGRGPLLLFFSYLGFHAFTTVRGAYSPAGRPLMFVWWIACLFIAAYRCETKEATVPWRLAAGLALFSLALICYHPLFIYQPVTGATMERSSALLNFLGSSFFNLSALFPSFLKTANGGYAANYLWLALLALALLIFYLKRGPRFGRIPPMLGGWLLFCLLGYLLCFWPHVHLSYSRRFTAPGIAFFNNSRNFSYLQEKGLYRIKAGDNYDIFLERQLAAKSRLHLAFADCREADVSVWSGRHLLFQPHPGGEQAVDLLPGALAPLTVAHSEVLHLGFQTRARRPDAYLFLKITTLSAPAAND